MSRGHFLRTLAQLDTQHMGREVTVEGLTGVLHGVIPVGDRVQLAMTIGGARTWTDWYPADTHIEIKSKEERP